MTEIALTADEARGLESRFLSGLEDAQAAYERIAESAAWFVLGFDSFASWWDERVRPAMRALSMRPTNAIAAAVIEKVREEEATLPPAQRRTQRELAEMVGRERSSLANRDGSRSAPREESPRPDLEQIAMPAGQDDAELILATTDDRVAIRSEVADVLDRLVPDPDGPRRQWRIAFLGALAPSFRLMAQFAAEQVADSADDECIDELDRLASNISSYCDRVRAARPMPDNVRHLKAVS